MPDENSNVTLRKTNVLRETNVKLKANWHLRFTWQLPQEKDLFSAMLWGKYLELLGQCFQGKAKRQMRVGVKTGRVKKLGFLNKFDWGTHPSHHLRQNVTRGHKIKTCLIKCIEVKCVWMHSFKTHLKQEETYSFTLGIKVNKQLDWTNKRLSRHSLCKIKKVFVRTNCWKYISTIFVLAWNKAIIFYEER